MAISISNATAMAACNAVADSADVGVAASTLVIYSGAVPASADTALGAQVALVTFALPDPAFGDAADLNPGAIATANAIASVQADATGTATFFRIIDGDGAARIQGSVTDTGGNGDLKLSSTAIIMDIDVTVVSLTITMPES